MVLIPAIDSARVIGGRFGRWLGVLLLVHFATLCALKISYGLLHEIWWMSHFGLFLAGIGLVFRSNLLVGTALTTVLIPHLIWLVDFACWLFFGRFLLGFTSYLAEAHIWTWIGTSHHFYLAPLLAVVVLGHKIYPLVTLPAAIIVYLYLSLICRITLSPASNINFAFCVRTSWAHPLLSRFNQLPGNIYLLGVNAFVCIFMFLPTVLIIRALTRRPNPGQQPNA